MYLIFVSSGNQIRYLSCKIQRSSHENECFCLLLMYSYTTHLIAINLWLFCACLRIVLHKYQYTLIQTLILYLNIDEIIIHKLINNTSHVGHSLANNLKNKLGLWFSYPCLINEALSFPSFQVTTALKLDYRL